MNIFQVAAQKRDEIQASVGKRVSCEKRKSGDKDQCRIRSRGCSAFPGEDSPGQEIESKTDHKKRQTVDPSVGQSIPVDSKIMLFEQVQVTAEP